MSVDYEAAARAVFADEGLTPHAWSNAPGFEYGGHQHPYDKVLICVEGSITFYISQGEQLLQAGDRLDLAAGVRHSATVGPLGVICLEAARE